MARKLAHENCQESSPSDSSEGAGKDLILSRRSYVHLGITTLAGLVSAGAGANKAQASQSESFTTNFSEYSA